MTRPTPRKRITPAAMVPGWFLDAKRAGADEAALLTLTRDFCRTILEQRGETGEPDEGWVNIMYDMYDNAYRLALTS